MSTKETILQQLAENPIIIYMKGVPSAPECGFSAKATTILDETKIPYTYVNVMKAPFIRERLPSISKWPTFPQLFVKGELIGGCDIVEAMFKDGSLLPLLQAATKSEKPVPDSNTISPAEVESLIAKDFPEAKIMIEGQGCDLTITVVSDKFDGLTMVKQHQSVMSTLTEPLASGRLHAVTLNTFTAGQWQSKQDAKSGLLQIQL
ncbi:MAG: Grx4 family monothiol glutaredoxin [Methylococcaceae bacterium]|nr:Grx4 family monothiol glutaredoxin [Methylococcaceae bacterium]